MVGRNQTTVRPPAACGRGWLRTAAVAGVLSAALLLARPGEVATGRLHAATSAEASPCHRIMLPAIGRRAAWSSETTPGGATGTPGVVDRCPPGGQTAGAPGPVATATATATPLVSPPGGASPPTTPSATPTPRPPAAYGCPCSVWDDSVLPAVPSQSDTQAVEVGVKFRSEVAGFVTGVRFYKGPANSGPHVGKLWSSAGTLLASAAFDDETATGWQQTNFAAPVPIAAYTTYVVSYHAGSGGYAANEYFFVDDLRSGPLRLLRDGEEGGNGVFAYGPSQFPTETYNQNNYSVDLLFSTDP
jgi:hypothetical protein